MKNFFKFFLHFIIFILLSFSAFCQEEKSFSLNPVKDGVLLGSGLLLSGSDLILDNIMELNRQEYDGKIYHKDDVNSFDRFFMHSYSKKLDKSADFLLAATMLTPVSLVAKDKDEWLTYSVMYAETLLIANGIKELTKLAVNRTRPYMYYDVSTFPEDDVKEGDWANSFPSGHSTMAFASATFTTYAYWKSFPDSKLKIPVAATSYVMALGVAALRVHSGNHFLSDVLTGAGIGTLTGFLVPFLHTFNKKNDLNISMLSNGFSVSLKL